MRVAAYSIIVTVGAFDLISSAAAADMTGDQIKAYLSGKTVYVQTTGANASGQAGQAVIYFGEDGTALQRTPSGAIMHGRWQIEGNTICPHWRERPEVGSARFDQTGDTVTSIDATTGQARARIVNTVPDNAERLTP
jgi:hypothetical protein